MNSNELTYKEEVKYNELQLAGYLLFTSFMIYGSFIVAKDGNMFGLFGFFIFPIMWIDIFRRLFIKKTAFTIYKEGIIYNANYYGDVFIAWDNIDAITIKSRRIKYKRSYFIKFDIGNINELIEDESSQHNKMSKIFKTGNFQIPCLYIQKKPEDIKAKIEYYKKIYTKKR